MARAENTVEKYLDKIVREKGGKTFKWTGVRGCPDRIVILPGGVVWFIEVKTAWGVLAPHQLRFMQRLDALGCNTRVVKGVGDVVEWRESLSC